MTRLKAWLVYVLCAMRGHDSVLHVEGHRMLMRCTSCGHDSPGWEVAS